MDLPTFILIPDPLDKEEFTGIHLLIIIFDHLVRVEVMLTMNSQCSKAHRLHLLNVSPY